MVDDGFTKDAPQFGTAEYARKPGAEVCGSCGAGIGDRYYRVNGAMTCPACAEQAQTRMPKDTHAAFMRGLLFGIGGAIGGLILYAGFGIITGLVIGYVSLAVGWIVGKAIKKGSNGIGGLRYQIVAVLLTYAAVSLSAIPIGIAQYSKTKAHVTEAESGSGGANRENKPAVDVSKTSPEPLPESGRSVGGVVGRLMLIGLASPFLELQDSFHGIFGLIILFVGLRIAWQMTGATAAAVLGPFKTATTTSPLSSP